MIKELDYSLWTRIAKHYLPIVQAIWLSEHVGPQKYYLHTQCGGDLWRYVGGRGSQGGYLEFARGPDATMFLLRWGA